MKGDHNNCQTVVNVIEQINVTAATKVYEEEHGKQISIDVGKNFLKATMLPFRSRSRRTSKLSKTLPRPISGTSGSSSTAAEYDEDDEDDEFIMCDIPCTWDLLPIPKSSNQNDADSSSLDSSDMKLRIDFDFETKTLRGRNSFEDFRYLAVAYA
jgi:hypothetical protein